MRNRDRDSEFKETVVHINRVAKVVKGGKNFSFSAVVVAGDGAGQVGYGTGKAREVPSSIQKAMEQAKREMIRVPMTGGTLPHKIWGHWGATKVLLRPASPGTGVIAGGGVRAVMESAGVQDVLTKIVGSRNPFNVVRATFNALTNLMTEARVRRLRGLEPADEPVQEPAQEPAQADASEHVAKEVPEAVSPAEESETAEATVEVVADEPVAEEGEQS